MVASSFKTAFCAWSGSGILFVNGVRSNLQTGTDVFKRRASVDHSVVESSKNAADLNAAAVVAKDRAQAANRRVAELKDKPVYTHYWSYKLRVAQSHARAAEEQAEIRQQILQTSLCAKTLWSQNLAQQEILAAML